MRLQFVVTNEHELPPRVLQATHQLLRGLERIAAASSPEQWLALCARIAQPPPGRD